MTQIDRTNSSQLHRLLMFASLLAILAGSLLLTPSHAQEGILPPCPNAPHCVSSLASTERHSIAPLQTNGTVNQARDQIAHILDGLPRVSYEKVDERRIEAVFTTRLMRFKDDVSFYIHDNGRIDVRSSSRIGYADFGANRRRVEMIRDQLQSL